MSAPSMEGCETGCSLTYDPTKDTVTKRCIIKCTCHDCTGIES